MRKSVLLIALLSLCMLVLVGCGAETVQDQFVFGKNRVACGGSVITVTVPFELSVKGKQSDLAPKDADSVTAAGRNAHMQLIVVGSRIGDDKDIYTVAASSQAVMENNAAVTDLQIEQSEGNVDGQKSVILHFTFKEVGKGQVAGLTAEEYIFRQDDVLWRVIYQYRTADAQGKELVRYTAGKIDFGAKL